MWFFLWQITLVLWRQIQSKGETTEQSDETLRAVDEKFLKVPVDKKQLKVSEWKMNVFLDCAATNNVTNDNSCKIRKRVQDGFMPTGQISGSADGKGANSCADFCEMIECTTNVNVLHRIEDHAKKEHSASRSYTAQSKLTEDQFNQHYLTRTKIWTTKFAS